MSSEDPGPQDHVLAELEQGTFESAYDSGGALDAEPLEGPARDQLWERFGPP